MCTALDMGCTKFSTTVTETQPQISTFYLHEITKKSRFRNLTYYQMNFQAILATVVMVVGGKYMTTCLGILDIHGGKSNIVHHVLKLVDNEIGSII